MLKIANHPIYTHPLPKGHRFPMEKYDLVPRQLLYEGTCGPENFFEPGPASEDDILAVHEGVYFHKLKNQELNRKEILAMGFPQSLELVEREIFIAGGTIRAAEYALEHGIAMNIAGGTHHAYTNRAEGFCLLHDQAIAARYLQRKKGIGKVLVVDLDVHQGNGTAEIFRNDSSVFTFSIHGKANYPFEKEHSDFDIEVATGTGDQEYLGLLKENLPRIVKEQRPEFVFFQCGVDILSSDKLGKLGCSVAGCKERDRFVLQLCADFGIPVECSMGGGYSRELRTIIDAHANTYRLAQEIFF